MRTRFHEPKSLIPEIKRCQVTIRAEFHIYPVLSDMHISSVGYQFGYRLAVGLFHSLHHLDFLGHFSSPFLGGHCLTLFNHNLLRYLLALGHKIYHDITLLQSQHCSHRAVPKDLPCQSPPILMAAYQSSANR